MEKKKSVRIKGLKKSEFDKFVKIGGIQLREARLINRKSCKIYYKGILFTREDEILPGSGKGNLSV